MVDEMHERARSCRSAVDCMLAALAVEHQAELQSNDSDFHRFEGLRWRNPLH